MTKPILFTPATKSYLWGGTALMEKWGKTSPEATVAECWELSAYAGCESIARGGDCDGMPLGEIVETHPDWFGAAVRDGFPILVKLIDAVKDLSGSIFLNCTKTAFSAQMLTKVCP